MSVLAIDAGTTGITALVILPDGTVAARGYAEFAQHFPRPGWVEHVPEEIWQATLAAFGGLDLPIAGIAGDQQAALFGQACFAPGEAKCTYGTGSFVLANTGSSIASPAAGLVSTVAWMDGSGALTYAAEGSIFVTGAAVQWLRDGLGLIGDAAQSEYLAASVPDSGGVVWD